jgi:glycosyltransferase involved in cell wall biosynthesis
MRFKAAFGILRAVHSFKPSVVYLNQAGCYRVADLICRIFKIPIVAHVRLGKDAAYLAGCRPKLRRLRAIISVSDWVKDELSKHEQLTEIPVHRIYDAYRRDYAVIRQLNCLNLACIGRVEEGKGQSLLLDALSELKDRNQTFTCLMIGSGSEFYRNLIEKTRLMGLEGIVRWMGFVPEPINALEGVSFVIVPSYVEALGRVIFDAWTAGCVPIVFEGSGGAAEIINASQGGVLYAEQTPSCLASAICCAASLSFDERNLFVANGRAWMEKNANSKRYAFDMQCVFLAAMSQ